MGESQHESCVMQSCQHGPETFKNVFNILWNPCPEELRMASEQSPVLE